MNVERFAPSPTGPLHLGHAFSAWTAWSEAKRAGGHFLLRMEDLDRSRVRPEYYSGIEEDLSWLGLTWQGEVLRQSDRLAAYRQALDRLTQAGLTYYCRCTRRDIADAISAPQEGIIGPDGPVYPGTCRAAGVNEDDAFAVRLNMTKAMAALNVNMLSFQEIGAGPGGQTGTIATSPDEMIGSVGDIVLRRRDGAMAYHLAVVVDDAFQAVTHVTRGRDLFSATHIHRVLQGLLDLPAPTYRHHPLVRDDTGKRLAKRDDARAIATYRDAGMTARDVLDLAQTGAR